MAIGPSPPLTADQVRSTAEAAARAAIPPFASMSPKPEGGAAAPGAVDQIARPDHVHPRLTATAPNPPEAGALDVNGLASVTFTQPFDVQPGVTVTSVGVRATGKPVPRFDVTFTMGAAGTPNAGKYVGATVYGERQRPLPTLGQASGGLLGALVTSVNTVLSPLSGFLPTEPAAGAGFSLIAVKSSAPAAS